MADRRSGKIKNVLMEKGYGFIRDESGTEYFFHQSSLEGASITDLSEGDAMTFVIAPSPKGPRAEEVRKENSYKH